MTSNTQKLTENKENQENKSDKVHDEFLWNQFIRIGERLGDGDLDPSEEKWMRKEYRKLSRILIPDTPEMKEFKRKQRAERNKNIDDQMAKLLSDKPCSSIYSFAKSTVCFVIPNRPALQYSHEK